MKKFIKFCLITALVLILLGLIIGIAGAAAGGNREVRRMAKNGELTFDSDFFPISFPDFDDGEDVLLGGGEGFYDLDDKEVFREGKEILSGDISYMQLPVSAITKLQITLGGGEFKILPSEDEHFYLEAKSADKLQVYDEKNTLYLKAIRTAVHNPDTKVTLYIPDTVSYEELELELGAGVLRLEDAFTIREADIEVGAGQMFLKNLTCSDLEVEVGAGELIGAGLQVSEKGAFTVGAGHLQVDADVTGNLAVECAMGSAELTLTGDEDAFDYEIDCAAGMIKVGDREFGGLSAERSLDNGAGRKMELECQMGAIEVTFKR